MFWVVRPLQRVQLSRAMFGSPISHRIQNGLQRQTIFCQGVINARRHLPKYLTANNSVSFQFTQLLGQHLLGDVRDVTLKLAKPTSAKTPFFFNDSSTTETYTLSLHEALSKILELRAAEDEPDTL